MSAFIRSSAPMTRRGGGVALSECQWAERGVFVSVQRIVDTTYSSWSNVQGHEEHFDEEREKRPVRRTGGCQGRWGYRSRVEARAGKSPRTMPSVTISPFGEMT
ncbi:hypothetical protein GCM10027187_28110 [Streptosporangium sandarakinum]